MTTRPDRHTVAMRMAQVVAERSTCTRARVGAVATLQGRVVATGYNGAPAGLPHCTHNPIYAAIVPDSSGQLRKDEGCKVATHAEANLIAWAARHGTALMGTELYCTMSPCIGCARLIINAGVTGVWFRFEYRLNDGIDLLTQVGIPAGIIGEV